jgi:two-component system LytT family response regulator
MDGLALADALGSGQTNIRTPSVVFVTGYDDYAIQAFERAAVDYLLKPVSRIRLATTLARLSARTDAVAKSLTVRDQPLTAAPIERLPIRIDYTVRLVSTDEIHAASAHGKRVHVVTADATYPTYYSLNQLEQRLPADKFLRVHDSWIVNLAEVLEIHSLGGQNYSIRLRSFDRLIPVSRRRYANLQHRLGLRG